MFLPSCFLGAVVGFLLCLPHLEASTAQQPEKPTAVEKLESFKQKMCEAINQENDCVDPNQPLTIIVVTRKSANTLIGVDPVLQQLKSNMPTTNGLTLVVFSEMFFGKEPLAEEQVRSILTALLAFSSQYPNVILLPHFLYKTDPLFCFRDVAEQKEFLDKYKNDMKPFMDGGKAKFKGQNYAKSHGTGARLKTEVLVKQKIPLAEKKTTDAKKQTMLPKLTAKTSSSTKQKQPSMSASGRKPSQVPPSSQPADQLNCEQFYNRPFTKPFSLLRSASIFIHNGLPLSEHKKNGYCFESKKDIENPDIFYDFSFSFLGQHSLCSLVARNTKQTIIDALRQCCSLDICFDLRLRAAKSSQLSDSFLHIIQSNTINTSESRLLSVLPNNTIIVQADPTYHQFFTCLKGQKLPFQGKVMYTEGADVEFYVISA